MKIFYLVFLLVLASVQTISAYWNPTGSKASTTLKPVEHSLSQNYPNPFNPKTVIEFNIGKEEFVTLKIYNIIGHEVKTIISETLPLGNHKYELDGTDLSSGAYIYSLTAGNFTQSRRMILLK